MSRPIEQALTELIPRNPGHLPPSLISLASSLLAQSRSKISNLRAEEEIGRTYACANIACERLKTSLNLPSIEPRPPCHPKTYKKLYAHLDSQLSAPTRRLKSSLQPTPTKPLPQKQTPVKEQSLEGFRSNRTPKRGLNFGKKDRELPKWVGVAIRKICGDLGTGKAVPHIWAGVESLWALEDEENNRGLPALVATVWLFVIRALDAKITSAKGLADDRRKLLGVLKGLRDDEAVVGKVGDEGWVGFDGMESMTAKAWAGEVDWWLSEVKGKGLLELEWRTNIVDGSGSGGNVEESGDMEVDLDSVGEGDESEEPNKRLRRNGLGTMMQAKFDYVSDEKREAYAIWKEDIMARIEGLTRDNMDTAEA